MCAVEKRAEKVFFFFFKPCVGLDVTCALERTKFLKRPDGVPFECSPLSLMSVAEVQLAPDRQGHTVHLLSIAAFSARL